MFRTRSRRRPADRRAAVLIVVLALLALFAIVGLAFVLLAQAEATASRNAMAGASKDGEFTDQQADDTDAFIGALLFDVPDVVPATNPNDLGLLNALRGHSLARSKYGYQSGSAACLSPFGGLGVFAGDTFTIGGVSVPRTQVINHTFVAGQGAVDPEQKNVTALRTDPKTFTFVANNYHPVNVPYTYPDRGANLFLAWMDPTTGEVTVPSFHRPDLFNPGDPLGSLNPAATAWWTDPDKRFKILRPRSGPGSENPEFPFPPPNAPDPSTGKITFTGDVCNLRYVTGSQKNDSVWLYTGSPVRERRGKKYVAMVAPLVLDLSGRVNLSVAGNAKNPAGGGTHASNHGFGPWEINPTNLLAGGNTDLQAIIAARYGPVAPPNDLYDPAKNYASLNQRRGSPGYALQDYDGAGSGADAMTPPGALLPFPGYPATRYAATAAAVGNETLKHPAQFDPLQFPRGRPVAPAAHAFGLDDTVRLVGQVNGRGNRVDSTELGKTVAPTSLGPTAAVARALTTAFSVSQAWSEVTVGSNRLGPIDLNRPLPDFRKNPQVAASPLNMWSPLPTAPLTEQQYYRNVQLARQNLARDVFVRLVALAGQVDGTNVAYNAGTGYFTINTGTAPMATLRQLAQVSANVVDYIDADDISTAFVWNPSTTSTADPFADPTNLDPTSDRVVFGTELPRLVVNEAYAGFFNDRLESPPPQMGLPPKRPATKSQKKFWVELHNPLPRDSMLPQSQWVLSDNGGARLRYEPTTTMVADTSGASVPYTGPDFNPYRLDVVEVAGAGTPYSAFLGQSPANVARDPAEPAAMGGAALTVKLRVNTYTTTVMTGATGDARNMVEAANGVPGVDGSNVGHYLMGPQDKFPGATPPTNTLSKPDPAAGAMDPVDAMMYETGKPTSGMGGVIETQDASTSIVILRRLANPYFPESPSNPYLTVDYLENVPTRDRLEYDSVDMRMGFTASAKGSVGRIHPYAAAPAFDAANPTMNSVREQQAAAMGGPTPPHTFFKENSYFDSGAGLAWLVHLDRELVNSTELLHVSTVSPALLTQRFYTDTVASPPQHQGHALSTTAGATKPFLVDPVNGANLSKALDLLTVGSRLSGVPLGGRESGKVNANGMAAQAVLAAVIDPQAGNAFATTDPSLATTAWTTMSTTRSPGAGGVPKATSGEGGTDQPYKMIGATGTAATDNTLLATTGLAASAAHPYFKNEPLRKGWNNLTTTSDGFLVIVTVGYFEVTNPGPWDVLNNPPVFGKELFDDVPGDLRAQFAAIVDRSRLVVPAAGTAFSGLVDLDSATDPAKQWQAKLTSDAAKGVTSIVVEGGLAGVIDEGKTFVFTGRIRLGYGDPSTGGDGEWVNVTGVTQAQEPDAGGTLVNVPGKVVLALGAATTLPHSASTLVSNRILGNPGPQAGFTTQDARYKGVVPFFTRVDP